jgi:hypothetical protein
MVVHPFGAVSSPACANVALRRTALDNVDSFGEKVIDGLLRSFYVDDLLSSVPCISTAITLVKDTTELSGKGGFHLRDWLSNSTEVNDSIPLSERAKSLQLDIEGDGLPVERTLGVVWSVKEDTLSFQTSSEEKPPTRRGMLSVISSVFDPLGIAAPFILPARILLQTLCKNKIGWDDPIGKEELRKWQEWLEELTCLEKLAIPRCLKPVAFLDIVSCQLHVFADASTKGYGIAAYVRMVNIDKTINCELLMGKSRVSPLKKITIPRMELTAASIAVKFGYLLIQEMDYKFDGVKYWTDSMSVIRYIQNQASRFHTFVANRLTTIHEGSEPSQWSYVPTRVNPADISSRGLSLKDTAALNLWKKGPAFLSRPESEWPKQELSGNLSKDDQEVKREVTATVVFSVAQTTVDELFARFSSWQKLKRVVGWIIKAQVAFRRRHRDIEAVIPGQVVDPEADINSELENDKNAYLTLKDLKVAELAIIRYEQDRYLNQDFKSKGAGIHKLDPFKDETGMIRVGGRLARSSAPVETKHPILLPKDSVVTKLILEEVHRVMGHVGRNAVLSKLRQQYWVARATKIIGTMISKCVVCRRYRAKVCEQKMAELPIQRLTGGEKAFTRSGMDYFGPLEIKRGRNTTVKRYGVLFEVFILS